MMYCQLKRDRWWDYILKGRLVKAKTTSPDSFCPVFLRNSERRFNGDEPAIEHGFSVTKGVSKAENKHKIVMYFNKLTWCTGRFGLSAVTSGFVRIGARDGASAGRFPKLPPPQAKDCSRTADLMK
jgi:hypothetical protein